jgi:hypothetical protein
MGSDVIAVIAVTGVTLGSGLAIAVMAVIRVTLT